MSHEDDDNDHKSDPRFAVLVWICGDWQATRQRYWTLADAEKAVTLEAEDGNPARLRAARVYD